MTALTQQEIDTLLSGSGHKRKHPLAHCEDCPLTAKKCVPSSGPLDAKLGLVSRSPGAYDTHGPFTGPSGKVVDYLLNENGLSREEVFLTNVVLCQTDNPTPKAIEACRPRLDDELRGIDTIIAGGAEATKVLTKFSSVASARGYAHVGRNGRRIIATNNPAAVIRDSDTFPNLITDFRIAINPLPVPTFPEVTIVDDINVARDILRSWRHLDTEVATDLEWAGDRIACAGFSFDGKRATTFAGNIIQDPECFELIRTVYENAECSSIWHNGKSDTTVLWRNNIRANIGHDTFLISYALDEEPGRHSLEYLLAIELGWPDYEPESVKHFKKNQNFDYYLEKLSKYDQSKLTDDERSQLRHTAEYELYEYNGWDAAGTYQLYEILGERAKSENVWNAPYLDTLVPAANAYRQMELNGMRFDAEESANILESSVLPALQTRTVKMRQLSDKPLLNPRSTDQMAALYYDDWGLKHTLKNKAKQSFTRSTGKEVREEIEGGRYRVNDNVTELVAEFSKIHQSFSKIEKQRANYFQSLIEKVDANGYIHPWTNLGGTVTGRTSSSKPNFQNITRQGVEGLPSVRSLFLASPGHVLIQADYSQAELRTMAQLSGDPKLLAIYNDNTRSLHKERAAAFYGENYTKEEYVKSKNINFGVSYGQSARAFAQMYHMPEAEAQAYIDSWWREFPTLHQWIKGLWKVARTEGVIVSPFGYNRRFHLITDDNLHAVQGEAVNFVPQNTAGVFTIKALTELVGLDVRVVNSVHDSIVADVRIDEANDVALLMKLVMESQSKKLLNWDLPFTVDVSMGETWATVEEIELEVAA